MDSREHPGETCSRTLCTVSLTALLCIIGLMLAGWASTARAGDPRLGGVLNFGVENDFAGFDVLKSGSRLAINGAIANNTIQEPLFRIDSKGGLVPVLGPTAMASEDGKDWTVTLRRDVVFHDGTSFDADAVMVHYQRLLDYVQPDVVHVMVAGRIVKSGGPELAVQLEEEGFEAVAA